MITLIGRYCKFFSWIFLIILLFAFAGKGWGQTTLWSETFESTNSLSLVQGSQVNYWARGTSTYYAGSYSLYTTNGSGNAYTLTSASVSHAYKDITIPTGATNVSLTFYWKGYGESTYDHLKVWIVDQTTTPVAGTQLTSTLLGTYNQSSSFAQATINLSAYAGLAKRLVFSWRNDGSLGTQPPAAIDNILITYTPAARPCGTCTPADVALGTIGTTVYGYSTSGNVGNGGKWAGSFTGEAGAIYHFDLCGDTPGSGVVGGTAWDADIKIVDASCAIISGAGVDGSCSSPSYEPNDFQWTCSTGGTYYVIIAPYNSYTSHTCTGTAANTFTMYYYKVAGCSAPAAPATNTNALYAPVNGVQHHILQSWSAVSGVTGYEYSYSYDNVSWAGAATTTGTSVDWNLADQPNQIFYTRVRAYQCGTPLYSGYTTSSAIYTACDFPVAPTVNTPTATTLNVTINAESPVANPAITTYSIYCVTTGTYVTATGALGAEVYQTKATWGTKTVTGLTCNTSYTFYVKAKNGSGDVQSGSSYTGTATTSACPCSPTNLTTNTPVTTSTYPTHYNFTNSSSMTAVVAVAPQGTADHDLEVYSVSGCQVGTYKTGSGYSSSTTVDFAISYYGNSATYYPSATYGSTGSSIIEYEYGTGLSECTPASGTMLATEAVDMYEIYLTSGIVYNFALDITSGGSNLGFAFATPTDWTARSSCTVVDATATGGASGDESYTGWTCPASGYYGIVVFNTYTGGAASNYTINVCPGCTTPGTPTTLSGSGTSETTANISWAAGSPAGSTTVTYYWEVDNNGTDALVTSGNTTSLSAAVTGLACGTTYHFEVRAYTSCNATYSSWATSGTFTTSACNPCSSVTAMTCGTVYSGTLAATGSDWSTYNGCSYTEPGDEKVYSYTPATSGSYTFTGTNTSGDADFFLMSTCGTSGTNIYGSCWSLGDATVTLTGGTTYYLIADNYSSSATAGYDVSVACTASEMIVPATGNNSYTVCAGHLYDNGGSAGVYTTYSDGYTVIYPGITGNIVQLSGTYYSELNYDYIYIYDGIGTAGTLFYSGSASTTTTIPTITSLDASGALTVKFTSDGSVQNSGFDLTISCISNEMIVPYSTNTSYTTCTGHIYDHGGSAGNYLCDANGYTVIYPSNVSNAVQLTGSYTTESGWDYIYIYDGDGTGGTLLGTYTGTGSIGTITSSGANIPLTIMFTSDGSVVYSGFDFTIACTSPCSPPSTPPSPTAAANPACSSTTLSEASPPGGVTYYWQGTNASGTSTAYPTSSTYTVTVTGTYYVRAQVTVGGCWSASSGSILVTVNPMSVGGSVTGGTVICSGSTSGTLTLSGYTGSITKWQYSNDNFSSDIHDISNTIPTYTSGVLTSTTYFRAVVSSGNCSAAYSSSTTVTVSPTSVGGSVTGGTTPICLGSGTGTMTLSGYTGSIIKWQKSSDGGSNWIDITNTITTYSETPSPVGTWFYRAVVQSGVCALANSNYTTIVVNPGTVGGSVTGGTTPLCLGSVTGTMTLSGHTGSVVKWQKRVNNGSWTDITNTITTYSETPSSAGIWDYRAVVQNGGCTQEYSNYVTITVNSSSTAPTGANASPSSINAGNSSTLSVVGGSLGTGANWYWYAGACGSGGAVGTGSSISVSPTSTTTYYVRAEASPCTPTTCATVTVTVTSSLPVGLYSNGGNIYINNGGYIYIDGGANGKFTNASNGSYHGNIYVNTNGYIKITGDWQNIASSGYVFTTDAGEVDFIGTTQSIGGSASTYFYNLKLTGSSTKTLNVNTQVGGSTTKNGVLTLDNNIALDLNIHTITVTNPVTTAIVRNTGSYIISENEDSKIKWCIGTNTGLYTYPFGRYSGSLRYVPFLFNITSAGTGSGSVSLSTYHTVSANTPLPSGVANINASDGTNNSLFVADRYWVITPATYTANPTATITFNYEYVSASDNEFYTPNTIDEVDLQAQRWDGTMWTPPVGADASHYVQVSGINVFSPWTLASKKKPLPVELLDFSAVCEDQQVTVKWTTASELNCDRYDINKSKDLVNWYFVGTVPGSGTTNDLQAYNYLDNSPYSGVSYYTLKQIDYDGVSELYGPVSTECIDAQNNSFELINILPNETRDELSITYNVFEDCKIQAYIIDALGQQLSAKKDNATSGLNMMTLPLRHSLCIGIYMITIEYNDKIFTQKIFIH
jgi:hypothetical protein